MNNGQLNVTSVQTAMPLMTQTPDVSNAIAIDGEQQPLGSFAEALGGAQLLVNGEILPETAADKPLVDAGTGKQVADLLAMLQAQQIITPAPDATAPEPGNPEETDINVTPVGTSSELTSQMALAAYSQPGRTPEVNTLTALHVDTLQKVATAPEKPEEKPAIIPVADPAEGQRQPVQAGIGTLPDVDGQTLATVIAATTAPAVAIETAKPESSDRTSDVNKPAPFLNDRLQNVAAATDQPAITVATTDGGQNIKEQDQKTVVQTQVTPSAKSGEPQAEPLSAHQTATATAVSPESEIEINLSQPLPITARVTAAPVSAAQDIHATQLRRSLDQQLEKVRTGDEPDVSGKKSPSAEQAATSDELTLQRESYPGTGSEQDLSNAASDDQMLAQNMRGQFNIDQQKITQSSARTFPAEPARQDIPEQVAQQVRERLVQLDVKQGSQQIKLTLSPDSLGELKMNLNLQGQKLSVEIVTENRMARDAIVQHVDALKESLARQNITMESFDVTTGGKGSGNQGQNQNAWRELAKQQQQQQLWASPRSYQTAQANLSSGQAAYQRQQGQSMLDIHY